jgi:hypothetical protein
MKTLLVTLIACAPLAGCGLGETALSAAAGGVSEVEQAKQAAATQARIRQQLDAAATVERSNREAAEKAAE